jgi:hypothetical protein
MYRFCKKGIVSLVFALISINAFCQREIDFGFEQPWSGIMTSIRVSERFSIYNDFHYGRYLFVAYRPALSYHSKDDKFVTTGGYANIKLSAPFSEGKLIRPEHRSWLQLVYRVPSTRRLTTSFRFKYETRFIRDLNSESLAATYSYNHRWRFNNSLRYNIHNSKNNSTRQVNTVFINESLFTTGPGPNGVFFEHRTNLMGEYRNGNFVYSAGYMFRFLGINPSLVRINHTFVFWITMNLNFKKNKETNFIENPEDH